MDGLNALDLSLFCSRQVCRCVYQRSRGILVAIVAAAVWLHFLSPAQAAPLIVAFGLIVQGVSVWKLRAAIATTRRQSARSGYGGPCILPNRAAEKR
jgi:hypothetical protein